MATVSAAHMNKQRITYLDTARCLGILLVLLGHCLQYAGPAEAFWSNRTWLFIYSFHMPLFMVVSGFFFGNSLNKPSGSLLKNKAVQLLLPCVAWSLLYVLLYTGAYAVVYHTLHLPPLFSELFRFWYLKALFAVFFIAHFSRKVLPSDWVACIVSVALVSLVPKMNVCNVSTMLPFFWTGHFLRKYTMNLSTSRVGTIALLCGSVFLAMQVGWSADKTMYQTPILLIDRTGGGIDWTNATAVAYRFLIGATGSIAVLALLRWVAERCPDVHRLARCNAVGRETLGIYLLQTWTLETVFTYVAPGWTGTMYYVAVPVLTVAELALCMTLIRLLERNRWSALFLLGKRS